MPAQTSYEINHPNAYPGQLADINSATLVSRSVEDANGADFGIAMSRGTDGEKQALVGIQSGGFLGISVRSLSRESEEGGSVKYRQNATAALLSDGFIFARCPSGCNPGDEVFADNATGVLDAGEAGAGETQLDSATWETSTEAGGVGVIYLYGRDTTAGS